MKLNISSHQNINTPGPDRSTMKDYNWVNNAKQSLLDTFGVGNPSARYSKLSCDRTISGYHDASMTPAASIPPMKAQLAGICELFPPYS
ncbi:hypothetical protein PGT21_033049 [Puccinia graminis f. sp. tritici]|uniref:Uncharacterized protein n=1 Tax=Puccinia graminis f. sp. tritici TaxID=56615 RepID=A0A5B0N8D0_PUCGR|nr:hypothetical protein PGT21_033049 [Puccinia graminis f. sp. tritici]KAA1084982.1 hypothetical protein PGTUg99_001122 [Puccinia graminis f. sp. tritici]KAA1099154.1 hypothetical protein PGTUg99_004062 [Puccinia graminis f. sp. tritici]